MVDISKTFRRSLLGSLGLSPGLLAVDPVGCGCTECLIGEYVPADQIPEQDVPVFQNLIRQGVLRDNTEGWFMPRESDDMRERLEALQEASGMSDDDFKATLRAFIEEV